VEHCLGSRSGKGFWNPKRKWVCGTGGKISGEEKCRVHLARKGPWKGKVVNVRKKGKTHYRKKLAEDQVMKDI